MLRSQNKRKYNYFLKDFKGSHFETGESNFIVEKLNRDIYDTEFLPVWRKSGKFFGYQ